MSWLFSRALAEAYSGGNSSGGKQSAQSNATHTPPAFWLHGKTMGVSSYSQFGTTCERLTEDRGEELLTSFLEDSRAKTSVSQARVKVSTARDLASGQRWRESLVRFDRDMSSWKTHLQLFAEDLPESSVILPRLGMIQDGVVYQPWSWEPRIEETDSGSWLPTPTATRYGTTNNGTRGDGTTFKTAGTPSLHTMAAKNIWPTITVKGNYNKAELNKKAADGLATAVNKAEGESGGPLNPQWVEWLMGWPIGWTDLSVLETGKCQQWRHEHGLS